MRGQYEQLLRSQRIGIEIRVIPAQQTSVLVLHPFLLMRFHNTTPVVHVELAGGNTGAFYVHGQDVTNFESLLGRLDKVALSRRESTTIITDLMEGL